MIRLFFGNLPHAATEQSLTEWIENTIDQTPSTINVIRDRITGHSRGFAFAEVQGDPQDVSQVTHVIRLMNNKKMDGRTLTVNVAFPKQKGGAR